MNENRKSIKTISRKNGNIPLVMERKWTSGMVSVLEYVKDNSLIKANQHQKRYYKYKSYLKYFKIPLICLSGLNSVISVGLQNYMQQTSISGLTCIISLLCAIITSLELYLAIQSTMENELQSSKEFLMLAIDINKMLTIEEDQRAIDPRTYVDDKHKSYLQLIERSSLLHKMKEKISLEVQTLENIKNKQDDNSDSSESNIETITSTLSSTSNLLEITNMHVEL
jgi:hypothetical protein